MKKMNHLKISLKRNTEKIDIPAWAKTIILNADTYEAYSDEKLNAIYNLFAKTLGMTADELRMKYLVRFHVRFKQSYSEYYVEFFDSVVNITRIFRAGMTLFPYPHLRFQIGDVVYCVGPERSIRRLADKLGNQEKKLDHPNLISIFLGIAVGILFGSLPIAIPGMPVPLKLGLAGGPLIVAILLGYYGPNFKLITYTTASANLMLREMGIALFLASVGLAAGRPFVDAILEGNGLLYAFLGLFITIIPLVVIGSIARKVYKMNYHSIVGMIAGATTDPPTLAYASTLTEKNVSAVAYSTVYPLAMFLRILSGQFVLLILWQYVS